MSTSPQLMPILCCPRCRGDLVSDDRTRGLRCANATCGLSQQGFATVEGKPVLIDPDLSAFNVEDVRAMSEGARSQRAALHEQDARSVLRKVYQSLIGKNPVAEANAETFLRLVRPLGGRILVVGGGTRGEGMWPIWDADDMEIVSFDVYSSANVSLVADGVAMPVKSGTFDGVWIQAVLEHVIDPVTVVAEIERVLKPGGVVYAETPFMQQVHEAAFDFHRFTHSAHRWLFRNFEEIASGQVTGAGTVLVWAIRYFVHAVTGSNMLGRLASLPFFWLRWFDKVGDKRLRLDAASGFFFLGRKCEMAMHLRDLPAYYRRCGEPEPANRAD